MAFGVRNRAPGACQSFLWSMLRPSFSSLFGQLCFVILGKMTAHFWGLRDIF
jgi:hypothetical protein